MRGFDKVTLVKDNDGDLCVVAVATDDTSWWRWFLPSDADEWGEKDQWDWKQLPGLPQPEAASNPSRELAVEILRKLDAGEITDEEAREHAYSCYGDHGNQLWAELDRRRSVAALAKLRGEAKP